MCFSCLSLQIWHSNLSSPLTFSPMAPAASRFVGTGQGVLCSMGQDMSRHVEMWQLPVGLALGLATTATTFVAPGVSSRAALRGKSRERPADESCRQRQMTGSNVDTSAPTSTCRTQLFCPTCLAFLSFCGTIFLDLETCFIWNEHIQDFATEDVPWRLSEQSFIGFWWFLILILDCFMFESTAVFGSEPNTRTELLLDLEWLCFSVGAMKLLSRLSCLLLPLVLAQECDEPEESMMLQKNEALAMGQGSWPPSNRNVWWWSFALVRVLLFRENDSNHVALQEALRRIVASKKGELIPAFFATMGLEMAELTLKKATTNVEKVPKYGAIEVILPGDVVSTGSSPAGNRWCRVITAGASNTRRSHGKTEWPGILQQYFSSSSSSLRVL